MGDTRSTTECGHDEAGGVVMRTPAPLPVNDALVSKCQALIRKMNRSERRRVHRALLQEAKTAKDKLATDNSNIVATRLTKDDYASVINICDDHDEDLSAFLRRAIHTAIKESR